MKKLFFTMTSFLLIFLFFACTKESEEVVPSFIEGKFVYSGSDIYTRELDWTNPMQITSDAKYVKVPGTIVGFYEPRYEKALWSHDGTQIMCIKKISNHADPSILVMDKNGENHIEVMQLNESILAIDWSPDGKWIAYALMYDSNIHLVSLDGQETKVLKIPEEFKLNIPEEPQINYIKWSYDSKKLLVYAIKNLFIFDATTEVGHILHSNINVIHKPCWSPNGEFIAHSDVPFNNEGRIRVSNVNDRTMEVINTGVGYSTVFGWTPDGEYLIYLNAMELTLEAIQISTGLIIDLQYKYDHDTPLPYGDLLIFP